MADALPADCMQIEMTWGCRSEPGSLFGKWKLYTLKLTSPVPEIGAVTFCPAQDQGRLQSLWRQSNAKNPGIPLLDLLALRLHRGGIRFQQLQLRQGHVCTLLLHLRVERAVRIGVDQHLLGFGAEEVVLEQFCRVRIGRTSEDAGGHNDQGRTFGG